MPPWKGIVGEKFTPPDFAQYVQQLTFGSWLPQFVVLHNTADPTFAEWHAVSGDVRMQGLANYYRGLGWSAGPHLFVADDFIWVFTPLTTQGVHSPSWNHIAWGVEMVGDYMSEELGAPVRDNTVSALATLHGALGLDPADMRFHKEDPRTTHKNCPGTAVDKVTMITLLQNELALRFPGDHLPDRPAV